MSDHTLSSKGGKSHFNFAFQGISIAGVSATSNRKAQIQQWINVLNNDTICYLSYNKPRSQVPPAIIRQHLSKFIKDPSCFNLPTLLSSAAPSSKGYSSCPWYGYSNFSVQVRLQQHPEETLSLLLLSFSEQRNLDNRPPADIPHMLLARTASYVHQQQTL